MSNDEAKLLRKKYQSATDTSDGRDGMTDKLSYKCQTNDAIGDKSFFVDPYNRLASEIWMNYLEDGHTLEQIKSIVAVLKRCAGEFVYEVSRESKK